MLTTSEATDAHALRQRGWTISSIARHLNHDRKTIRGYLTGDRTPGARRDRPSGLEPFIAYCRQRFVDDQHLPASTLLGELKELGYQGSYSALTRTLRLRGLRPDCVTCRNARTHAPPRPLSR